MNLFDLALIAVYLVGITLFGLRFRKKQRSLRDYFLADRNIPWWAIALSIVAAETSTLTIIGVPGLAYDTNFTFLQLIMGYLVGRVIISYLLLPHYFRGDLFTAYQLIERRFGGRLRSLTAGLFLVTRAAAEGVRIFAVALVVGIALGPLLGNISELQRDVVSIGIVTMLTLLYTFEGGMAAVIWTDVVQLAFIWRARSLDCLPSCTWYPADGPPFTRRQRAQASFASSTSPRTSIGRTPSGRESSAELFSLPQATAPIN
jgi:Na+/proline symporter